MTSRQRECKSESEKSERPVVELMGMNQSNGKRFNERGGEQGRIEERRQPVSSCRGRVGRVFKCTAPYQMFGHELIIFYYHNKTAEHEDVRMKADQKSRPQHRER